MSKASGPTYKVGFRRRRECVTDYRKRLALLKSGQPRLIVRKSNRLVIVQLVKWEDGDHTVASASSNELKKFGWPPRANLPTAYLTALLCGLRAKKAGVSAAVLDTGLARPTKGSFIFAALKGAIDAGLDVPHGEELFDEARISGAHIASFAGSIDPERHKNQFSAYVAAGVKLEDIPKLFDDVKSKISKAV